MKPPEEGLPAPVLAEVCLELLDEAPIGIFILRGGRVVAGNSWMREFSGCAVSEERPLDLLALVHPDDRALVSREVLGRPDGRASRPGVRVRLLRGDGAVREGEIFTRGLRLRGGAAIQGTIVDCTARAASERGLHQSAARLEESNRHRQLFSDILSHDLMNPVWVAENYLRLILDAGVPEATRPLYEGMRGALAKARGILTDARTYLRSDDRIAFSLEPVDLGRLVEQTAQGLRPLWEEKGQSVSFSLAADAVCSAGPLLREVVWHLLSNAITYGPPGSPIEVGVSAGPPVRLEVRDRGPGVPQADREAIFRRFERIEKGAITGVGLGLAIVRRLLAMYQGRVWVEDNPGGGSVFVAELPAADVTA